MTKTTKVITTGEMWNRFYSDGNAWPEVVYHDDTLLAINGKENPGGELENLPPAATVEICCGIVFFPDGSHCDLGEYFLRWKAKESKPANGFSEDFLNAYPAFRGNLS